MHNIEEKTKKLLKELDINNLKEEAKRNNILLQCLLQKLMLGYTVDIGEQLAQKQEDIITTYPTELITSLKVISDLYLKMKAENSLLKTDDNDYNSPKVF